MTIDVKPADFDIESLEVGEAIAIDWTDQEYFSDRRAVTRSTLALAPADLNDWQQGESGGSSSASKRFGTWAHLALLEPSEWIRRVGVPAHPRPPGASGNAPSGTAGREDYDTWQRAIKMRETAARQNLGDEWIDVSLSEFNRVLAVAEAVSKNHVAAALLLDSPGHAELAVVWRHPPTGLLIKSRLDRLTWISEATLERVAYLQRIPVEEIGLSEGWAVPDLKTTDDESPWSFDRSARKFGYYDQAAIYSDVAQALLPDDPINFYFIAAKSSSRFGVAVYRPSPSRVDEARDRYNRRLNDLLARRFTNDWRQPWHAGVHTLGE